MSPKRLIFILVDGLGIPLGGWTSSFLNEFSPDFIKLLCNYSIPVNVDMGIPGLPQSATGQSSLFTGCNTAAIMKRHVQGFPGRILKKIIREKNIFNWLIKKGFTPTFANAYVMHKVKNMRFKSVTTVMVESSLNFFRGADHLRDNDAVYHDITRETITNLQFKTITPEKAAEDLLKIAQNHHFTLFEYFLTDLAGHKRDIKKIKKYFSSLGRFVVEISKNIDNSTSFILTSDHGNIEDISVSTHTLNPVPLMTLNFPLPSLKKINIYDIFSLITKHFEVQNA